MLGLSAGLVLFGPAPQRQGRSAKNIAAGRETRAVAWLCIQLGFLFAFAIAPVDIGMVVFPLIAAAALGAMHLYRRGEHWRGVMGRLPVLCVYIGATLALMLAWIVKELRIDGVIEYARFLYELGSRVKYPDKIMAPDGYSYYRDFNEWDWMRLPLLFPVLVSTLAYARWLDRSIDTPWDRVRGSRIVAIVGMTSIATVQIVVCVDEMHILALLLHIS